MRCSCRAHRLLFCGSAFLFNTKIESHAESGVRLSYLFMDRSNDVTVALRDLGFERRMGGAFKIAEIRAV